jgi:hypothetical protein
MCGEEHNMLKRAANLGLKRTDYVIEDVARQPTVKKLQSSVPSYFFETTELRQTSEPLSTAASS